MSTQRQFTPFTAAEKAEFAAEMEVTRRKHWGAVEHLVSLIVNGEVAAVSSESAKKVEKCVAEVYSLQQAKAPYGVKPKQEEVPELQFKIKTVAD